jgi:hypothetical protein
MEEKKFNRAVTWGGGGGAVLAFSSILAAGLLSAGLLSAGPSHGSTVAAVDPCHSPGCRTGAHTTTSTAKKSGRGHDGRVTPRASAVQLGHSVLGTSTSTSSTSSTTVAAPPKPSPWLSSLANANLAAPIVGMATANGGNLILAGSDGGVFPVGPSSFIGSLSGKGLSSRIAAVAANPATGGYWLVGRDGGVFAFKTPYHGSLSGKRLGAPIVAAAATPSGGGYILTSSDGGVFSFGDAGYHGSLSGKRLTSSVVAAAMTPTGHGYWLISNDGGVFAFGDASYHGSLSGNHLSSPVVAVASTPSGRGYWLVSKDGGLFAFGDAGYHGALSGTGVPSAVSAVVASPDGQGYWLSGQSGWVKAFGTAHQVAQPAPPAPPAPPTPAPKRATQAAGRPVAVRTKFKGYKSGSTGYDVSQYQCGGLPPAPGAISVVQVSGGALDNAPNPCYVQEARWAGRSMSAYIYLDGLPSPAPTPTLSGPAGKCVITNIACASYNYGYNYVRYWVAYSRRAGVDPKLWWLDVERESGWQDTISNQLVVRGALGALRSLGLTSGIYSSPSQWREITGGLAIPGEAEWVPGAGNLTGPGYSATSFCAAPGANSFGGGRLKMVQYGYQGPFVGSFAGPGSPYDLDVAC